MCQIKAELYTLVIRQALNVHIVISLKRIRKQNK